MQRLYSSNHIGKALSLSILLNFCLSPLTASATNEDAISENNAGVGALQVNDYQSAISKFKHALAIAPGYKLARENLSIAFNNAGLAHKQDYKQALADFHMAAWLMQSEPNPTVKANLESILRYSGKDPARFADRVSAGDSCAESNDFAGAIVEYKAALRLQDDKAVQKKLQAIKVPTEWQVVFANANAKVAPTVDFGPYMAKVMRTIKANWTPPKGEETSNLVAVFKVNKHGLVSDLKLEKSSTSAALDQSALAAVRRSEPFSDLPKGSDDPVTIQFTFDYNAFNKSSTEREAELKRNIAKSEKAGDNNQLAENLLELGRIYVEQEKIDKATQQFNRAIKLLETNSSKPELMADLKTELGDISYNRSDFDTATKLYRDALKLFLEAKASNENLAKAYNDIGLSLQQSSDNHNDEAMKMLELGLSNAQKAHDKAREIDAKDGLAFCYYTAREFPKARDYYVWVVDETEKLDGKQSSSLFRHKKSIADCDYALEDYRQALESYQDALKYAPFADSNDQDEIDEAKGAVDELSKRLNIETPDERAQAQEEAKETKHAFDWLPIALGASLLSLLLIYFISNRNNSKLEFKAKENDDDSPTPLR
jgi:TonB family protein